MNINRIVAGVATTVALGAVVPVAAVSAASAANPAAQGVQVAHDRGHGQHAPHIVKDWLKAWNAGDGKRLGSLFTKDGRYTDHAFGPVFVGPAGVEQWVANTYGGIDGVHGDLRWAERHGDEIVFGWTFSGHIKGAPNAFKVPAVTVLKVRGSKIASNDDYYSFAEVAKQSGLPADWNPGA